VVQDGDLIHVIMRDSDAANVERVFGKGPGEH
jgi:hypothetical protein